MAVVTSSGKLVERQRCPTNIPELRALIEQVKRPRFITFEEGPLAAWLGRNLRPLVDELVVCDPRRNHLIAKDSDKDDPIDAEKLAQLFRGNYLRAVHHPESFDRELLKQHVSFYHDRVRERVRQGHQLTAQLRRHGVFVSIAKLQDPEERRRVWRQLPQRKVLLSDLDLLWEIYELMSTQEEKLHAGLNRLARREEPVRRFIELPGIAWVRAVTCYVYLDTPWRFPSKSALHRYCGIGLERRHSGNGPLRTRLAKQGHRRLKNALLGAARSAIDQGDNPFAQKYVHWTHQEGMPLSTARRNVARCLATTLWSLWKTGNSYDPQEVGKPIESGRRSTYSNPAQTLRATESLGCH
jgi:transposase